METSFAHLEEKVVEAVNLIKSLRAEIESLQRRNNELQAECEQMSEKNARLEEELGHSQDATLRVEQYEEKRRLIEEKVGGLLEKLEALG
jgi:FtsZ-binding cell division protein ZapB